MKYLRLHDRWIMARMSDVTSEMTELLDGYFFGESAKAMYDFVWSELCDWYLEMSKPALKGDDGAERKRVTQIVLYSVFRDVLKLLHPFIPFVTEELWRAFAYGDGLIGRAEWPAASGKSWEAAKPEMEYLQEIIRAIRNLRAEVKLPPQKMAPFMSLRLKDTSKTSLVDDNRDLVTLIAKVEKIELASLGDAKPPKSIATVTDGWELLFPVGSLMDVEREIERFQDELGKLESEMKRIRGKLENKNFVDKAPPEVVEKERAAMEQGLARRRRIEENLEGLRQS